ncbi:NHL repeat family protein [Mycobacterium xenopi 3993]|nr:NHL repeat family protein [Mycobacterium xenopi 3993]
MCPISTTGWSSCRPDRTTRPTCRSPASTTRRAWPWIPPATCTSPTGQQPGGQAGRRSNTQSDLPFTDLNHPDGVAVDTAGNVYVTDTDNNRVLKLEGGSNQVVLPFTGVSVPWGVGVDKAGNVYATEHDDSKVVKLAAGTNTTTVLPFTGLNTPLGVVVDDGGNVYVADRATTGW